MGLAMAIGTGNASTEYSRHAAGAPSLFLRPLVEHLSTELVTCSVDLPMGTWLEMAAPKSESDTADLLADCTTRRATQTGAAGAV